MKDFDLVLDFNVKVFWLDPPENNPEKMRREIINSKIQQDVKAFQYIVQNFIDQFQADWGQDE